MTKPTIDMERLQRSINAQMKGDLRVEDGSYPGCLPGCLFSTCSALCILLMVALIVSQI